MTIELSSELTSASLRNALDAVLLDRFEALVHLQPPASQPWEPVTDYSFEARKAIEGIHPQLIKDVFQPTSVLDVGCGPGHLVRLLREIGIDAGGCDLSTQGDRLHYFRYDVSQRQRLKSYNQDLRPPDLVICREVLEHLTIRGVRHAVENLCFLSSRYVYVTTRFAKDPQHLLDVDTSDDLDPTHITMLNPHFLRLLFVLEGFKRRPDLEARMDWKNLGRVLVYERG